MQRITACLDSSSISASVNKAAIWLAKITGMPLSLMHTIEHISKHETNDLSGYIGLENSVKLLQEITRLDEKKNKLAREYGSKLLHSCQAIALQEGVQNVDIVQHHGDILDVLTDIQATTSHIVMGRAGESHQENFQLLGSHIESAIRQLDKIFLLVPNHFITPKKILLAVQDTQQLKHFLYTLEEYNLVTKLECHAIMLNDTKNSEQEFQSSIQELHNLGLPVVGKFLQGEIVKNILNYAAGHNIHAVVIGAFGHSKLQQFFLGSNTMRILEQAKTTVLVVK